MPELASIVQEHVTFDGAAGRIEAVLSYPEDSDPQTSVLIVGPHPMLGGDFNNNVVLELANRLAEHNAATLRFNYRGVGQSAGTPVLSTNNIADFWTRSKIDDESGFAQDTTAAATYLATTFGAVNHVVGYSFGAWLASRWATESGEVSTVALVAPTISQHDYSHLAQCLLPKIVIAGLNDFAVPTEALRQQFAQWSGPNQLIIEDVDNHFFRGHQRWLADEVSAFQRGVS